jgi:hypothetical protein
MPSCKNHIFGAAGPKPYWKTRFLASKVPNKICIFLMVHVFFLSSSNSFG